MNNDEFHQGMISMLETIISEQRAQRRSISDLKTIAIDTNAEVTTIRSRLIEQASRYGQEIHSHETALIKQDARITLLERKSENDFEPDIILDAE